MDRGTRGFTLIELLVVVAIIAILAAVLLPVFISAKQRAMTMSCVSNIHELSRSVLMYVDDNGAWMVPAFNEPAGSQSWTWRYAVMRYVKNRKIWVCPAFASTDITPQQWNNNATTCIDDIGSSYGINWTMAGCHSSSPAWAGSRCHKVTEYQRHSRTLFLLECKAGFYYPYWQLLMKSSDDYIHRLFPTFHQRRMVVSFLDGHTRHMYIRDTLGDDASGFLWGNYDPNDAVTIAKILRLWPRDYPPYGAY